MSVKHEYVFLWRRHRNNPAKKEGFSIRSGAQSIQIPFFCSEIPVTLLTKAEPIIIVHNNFKTESIRKMSNFNF